MGRPTPETGGGASQNQGLSEFKPLAKERGVGWGVKKPEEPKQQPADPNREAFERFLRSTPMRPAVFRGHERLSSRPSDQRGKTEPSKPNPEEQRGKQPGEEAGQEQPEPSYSAERIEEARKTWPDLTTEQIIYRLKDEDQRAEDKKRGRRRGFGFF
jgi:hypothetical protein